MTERGKGLVFLCSIVCAFALISSNGCNCEWDTPDLTGTVNKSPRAGEPAVLTDEEVKAEWRRWWKINMIGGTGEGDTP